MRFLSLGITMLCIGFSMIGASSTVLMYAPATMGMATPLLGSFIAVMGFVLCRPALALAKAENKRRLARPKAKA